jgi:uncharacterized protein YprB with RNaseH-like and TPR domain
MLKQTFLHLPDIGETTEHKLWSSGIRTWNNFIVAHAQGLLRGHKIEHAVRHVIESIKRYEGGDWNYFDQCLPSNHKWRAFSDLGDRALYVDIETTGLLDEDCITVIGTYDGKETKSFIADVNLDKAVDEIEAHPLIVTFNGAQFDMPLIRRRFHYNFFNHVHIDLRFPLKRLGFAGGLKKIEQDFGIERSERTKGLDGWDAVRLWHEYRHGHDAALKLLVEYNGEDIKNLEPLMRFAFGEMTKKMKPSLSSEPGLWPLEHFHFASP